METKIPEIEARNILETYEGANNQLLEWKTRFLYSKNFKLTRPQADYILRHNQITPKVTRKYINITKSFGEKLQEEKLLSNPIEKIWCEKLLCETDKAYHIWGKFFDSEQNRGIWLPKGAIIPSEKKLNRVIDYSKYDIRPPLEHQKVAIEKLLANDRFILADEMGAGKTTSAIIGALESGVKKILVVCPASLKINWLREIKIYTDRKTLIVEGRKWGSTFDFYIINYDILKNYHTTDKSEDSDDYKLIVNEEFDLAVIDECFTYDSKIMTEYGEMNIGDIVENSIDVKILCYNHITQEIEYKNINRWIKKNKDTIYQIKLSNGVYIECTDNHKFYTNNRGYVKARDIDTDDDLYLLSKTINKKTNNKKEQNVLEKLWINNDKRTTAKKNIRKEFLQKLFKLWKNNVFYHKKENGKTQILFNKMRFLLFNEQRRCKRKKKKNNNIEWRMVESNETNAQRQSPSENISIGKNEEKQSYVKSKNSGENETKINWKNFSFKRRSRKTDRATNFTSSIIRRRMGNRITNLYAKCQTYVQKFTPRISGRYWKSEEKNFNRNRWKNTHTEKMEILRQKKNRSVEFVRMESYKILEQGSYDKSTNMHSKNTRVYDLEIHDNHNYFINNVLVSNCHYLANPSASRTKLLNDILKEIPRVWLLTGTPMTNRPINYFNLLKIVHSPVASNWQHYVKRYCRGFRFKVNGRTIWNTSGHSNLDELRELTKNLVLRRLKSDVLDLPEKIITPIFLELKSTYYNEELEEFMRITKENKHRTTLNINTQEEEPDRENVVAVLGRLMKVRQVLAFEKISYTCELIDKALEQDKKVLVFTNFTMTLDMLHEKYKKISVILDGRMTKEKKQESIDRFQNDKKIKVFVLNIIAGGLGHNLTEAEVVIMNDLSFVPSHHSQSEDRAHRPNQKNNVVIYYPIFENTIEQIIYNILQSKKNVIDQVMGDGEYSESFAKELMKALI